jgi:predicted nucleic acid-binding protein
MPAKVADASVIAAIAFGEPRASEAEALLDRSDITAPTLLAYELTSVAVKKARLYPDRADAIEQALLATTRLDIQWIDVDFGAVLRLALATGLTAYDASYLHLAQALRIPLATFDEQLQTAARNLA